MKPQSAGGKATAIIFRKKALDQYYANPSNCLNCKIIIHVLEGQKVRVAKRKKFCSKSCAAKFNNMNRPKKDSHKELEKSSVGRPSSFSNINNLTKKELFDSYKNYQSARSRIQKHARHVYFTEGLPKKCLCCGYDKHIEVCHLHPVSEFQNHASIILEINNPKNLIALCPTHHWEFDNKLLFF